ncbi:SNF2-related protein [Peribacillus butanolivorans]|uniref:Helicase SNF2 n=1 Tax=Peribacillus butanolivorans TaxID=421767 RepID=A0ABM6XIP3_9BACI|nr:SNF2-related protein [Peribacillus butanolivorans]AXN38133.1 helicase SNF2 [Peribacillus butanolivorans]QNU03394.1 DEAD/DEAH box helicase family protein [Peribacillus butanolivorans]
MFDQLTLYPSYYTDTSDIVEEFYNPVLSVAKVYDRVSAYFSSKALAAYAKGLSGLINNGGKMRLIVSLEISEDDFESIKRGYALREELKNHITISLEDELTIEEEKNYCNLAHLIANGYVDVKIGFTNTGIFHSKFGLCKDSNGNVIYFTGSNNETEAAIRSNYEAFDITASWLCSDFDIQKLYRAESEFEKLWSSKDSGSIVYVKEINEIIKKKIIQFDRGRVILNIETLTDDALILAYEGDKIVLYDNLKSYKISSRDMAISQRLLPYYDGGYPNFSSDLTYIEMNEVIKILEKYAKRKRFNFIVSKSLKEYLSTVAYFIKERADYGKSIKYYEEELDPIIADRFENFKSVVENELERTLRLKQMWSAFYMYEMKNAANFSVPGAGKTSMIYGAFAYLNSTAIDKVDKLVMLGPKNSFLSWKDEFKSNFADKKTLKFLDVQLTKPSEFEFRFESGDRNLILVNYESLPKYESALLDIIDSRTMLVFDEVHKIKGITSIRAQAAKRVSAKAGYKYVLTGTPIPNTYQDIYNLLNILYDDEYKIFFNFKKNDLKEPSPIMVEKINDKLYPFFWRTTKKELEVPPANEDDLVQVPASNEEQEIINLLYRKYGRSAFHLYIRLIQASANPDLLLKSLDYIEMYGEENNPWKDMDPDAIVFTKEEIDLIKRVPKTSKYYAAIDLAEDLHAEGKQSIIWCMFVDTINKVYQDLRMRGIRAGIIYGSTPQDERDKMIKAFLNKEIEVLVTNPHTLAESVSLHHTCHDAIYLEYSFNLTHMLQSRDRIHRLGLKDTDYTQYYYFILQGNEGERNTIDERIYYRLKEKEKRMVDAIERGVLEPDPEVDLAEILSLFDN